MKLDRVEEFPRAAEALERGERVSGALLKSGSSEQSTSSLLSSLTLSSLTTVQPRSSSRSRSHNSMLR